MLEQLCSTKEKRGGLLGTKSLADIEQIDDAGEECPAFSRTNWRFVEDPGFLYDRGFIVVVRAKAALVLFLRCKGHCENSASFAMKYTSPFGDVVEEGFGGTATAAYSLTMIQ